MNYIDNRCKYSCWVGGFDCCWVCWAFLTSSRHHNLEGRCWQFKQLINIQLCKTLAWQLASWVYPSCPKSRSHENRTVKLLDTAFHFPGFGAARGLRALPCTFTTTSQAAMEHGRPGGRAALPSSLVLSSSFAKHSVHVLKNNFQTAKCTWN